MKRHGTGKRLGWYLALLVLPALAACSSTSVPKKQFSLTEGLQAPPTDFQIACSEEAERKFGLREQSVFPLGSSANGQGAYFVHLYTPQGDAMCIIEEDGHLVSVSRI